MARSPYSKSITDNPDATDLFFHRFLLCLAGFLCACRAQWLSRIISCWRLSSAVKAQIQSVVNPIPSSNTKLNPWKDKIRRIGVIRELFEHVRTEPKAKEHVIRYCLPDSSLLLSYNPETSSRVTLASLGIVFQTTKQQNNKTTRQPDNKTTRQPFSLLRHRQCFGCCWQHLKSKLFIISRWSKLFW